ncbi:MAG: ferrous iron transport protein B, partial [Elusimicrobiales bacterium]|nr:ferrous iron transport protein B [Elusimicrobiales bacterium]
EVITRNYIIEEKPDVIVNVLDGTNLERNLYLTTQLMELEVNSVIALNMYDEVKEQKIEIDFKQLEKLLGSHIIPTNSIKKEGFKSLLNHIVRVHTGILTVAKNKLSFSEEVEKNIERLTDIIKGDQTLSDKYHPRWLAIKLLENDQLTYSAAKERAIWLNIEKELLEIIPKYEDMFDSSPAMTIAEDRHSFIRGAIKETVEYPKEIKKTLTDYIDSVLINRVLGLPIFLALMWLIFQFTFKLGEAPMGWIETFFGFLGEAAATIIAPGLLQSVIVDGIIAGVGGVLVFLPSILLLFLFLSFLEGTGYMARAAFVVDKVLHKVGLHGKSFIPMITGFGCSVPAFMSCRTLKSKADRITTMMIIPFMSCGAKLPVYILLIGAFFPVAYAGNILFAVYLFGIIVAILSAKILKTGLFKGESEPFVMELPPYRMPTLKAVLIQMWIKAYMYIKKAGTIVLLASVVIWFAGNFPASREIDKTYADKAHTVQFNQILDDEQKESQINEFENIRLSKQLEYSYAGRMGKFIEPIIRPIGFDWRIGISLVAGLAAKEVVVATMGTIYSLGGEEDEGSSDLAASLRNDKKYDIATALSLMIFVLLYIPCLAATVVFHKEAGAWKWTSIYIAYSMTVAWVLSFAVYNISKLFLV